MSQENVEVVAGSWQAFADAGLDAMAEYWDADISWRAMAGAPDDVGEMREVHAVRGYAQDWLDTFDELKAVPEEVLDAGDDRVIAVLRLSGRARLSGVPTELRYAVLCTVRAGKIVRTREYADREQALAAARAAGEGPLSRRRGLQRR